MTELVQFVVIFILLFLIFWLSSLVYSQIRGAPTVYSSTQAIRDAIKLTEPKKGETLVDLGCGNAKSLILGAKEFGLKGIGVEYSLYCYLTAKIKVFLSGQKNIKIYFRNIQKSEDILRKADIVYLYLLNSYMAQIEPWFFENVKEGSRIVSLCFQFPKTKAARTSKTKNLGKSTTISLYQN